jgi:hypothetical protein
MTLVVAPGSSRATWGTTCSSRKSTLTPRASAASHLDSARRPRESTPAALRRPPAGVRQPCDLRLRRTHSSHDGIDGRREGAPHESRDDRHHVSVDPMPAGRRGSGRTIGMTYTRGAVGRAAAHVGAEAVIRDMRYSLVPDEDRDAGRCSGAGPVYGSYAVRPASLDAQRVPGSWARRRAQSDSWTLAEASPDDAWPPSRADGDSWRGCGVLTARDEAVRRPSAMRGDTTQPTRRSAPSAGAYGAQPSETAVALAVSLHERSVLVARDRWLGLHAHVRHAAAGDERGRAEDERGEQRRLDDRRGAPAVASGPRRAWCSW